MEYKRMKRGKGVTFAKYWNLLSIREGDRMPANRRTTNA
jgi:hypothetical protein